MFSPIIKKRISDAVQKVLQDVSDEELPSGEIQFILHVDGKEDWSWANIRNESAKHDPVPEVLIQNLSV